MTTTTITAHANVCSSTNILAAIRDFFANFCAGIREGNEIEARYRKFSHMAPSELAALGLTRADIARAALNGSCFN